MSRFGNARRFIGENGLGSYIDYAKARYLTHAADKGLMRGVSSKRRSPRIIASFTSYPARLAQIEPMLKSLLVQLMKPDKLILWLSEEQYPNAEADVPDNIRAYGKYGLEIRFCPGDIRSHKKYVFAMREFPNDLIVTFDDDLIYHNDTIRLLYQSYQKHPTCISALRTHLIKFDESGSLIPYRDWAFECSDYIDEPRMDLFATTGGGTLFPPHCLHPEVLNVEALMECCPNADDVWIKVMATMVDTPVVLAAAHRPLVYIDELFSSGLWYDNIDGGGNDAQIAKTLARYDTDILARIRS